ncbi:hypothetical protein FRC09_002790 [Ceratobasidium sp. 395]|nr:hypothetical protein FRC09_002790 [Ceratobasidium sp. 395]
MRDFGYSPNDDTDIINEEHKHGPGRFLACICPLVSLSVSIDTLDRFCLDVISRWRSLERLEIVMNLDEGCSLPEISELAFPRLKHLALYTINFTIDVFNTFWSVPALVGNLTSVKFAPVRWSYDDSNNKLLMHPQTLANLVEKSPHVEDIWLKVHDVEARNKVLDVPIAALDALLHSPLQSFHLEGVRLTGCENVPNYLAEAFPRLKMFGLPDHMLDFADLRTFQARMPQLESIHLGINAASLSSDLDCETSRIPHYRQSPFCVLNVNFLNQAQFGPWTSARLYEYHHGILLVRYLFSLWPYVQLRERRSGDWIIRPQLPDGMLSLINDHLSALSYCNNDPTVKYEDVGIFTEELWVNYDVD